MAAAADVYGGEHMFKIIGYNVPVPPTPLFPGTFGKQSLSEPVK